MGKKSGQPATDDPSADNPSQQGKSQEPDNILSATTDQPVTDDLLHAAHVLPPDLPPDMVANVEQTLDHLSATVDLFDVPPFDYGDDIG